MRMEGSSEIIVESDVGVDPEAALSRFTYTVTNKDLRLAVRKLVQCAKRAEHAPLHALPKQLKDFCPLRIAQSGKSFTVSAIPLSQITMSADVWFCRLWVGEKVG